MPTVDISLALAGVTLRATAAGVGPTVLLLHAGGENRGVWTPVTARLVQHGLRTVAFDLRGHGDSSGRATTLRVLAEDVAEMVRRAPAPIVVVGASLGGLAGVAALAEPSVADRVAGLVLVDVVPDPDAGRVRAWLGELGPDDRHTDLVADTLAAGPGLHATTAMLDLPILVVRAGRRSPIDDGDVARLRAAGHRVTVAEIPDAGHLVARDAPAELARIVATHASRWLATEDVVRDAEELLRGLGAEGLEHPGGTLYAHLRRVHRLAADWNATPRTQLAALCHAVYGTDGFGPTLLPATERPRVREIIGADAEALVHLYGACARSRTYPLLGARPLPMTDRFTGESSAVDGADLRDFAVLTIANELDVARHGRLPASTVAAIRRLVAALAGYAPDAAASALADEALT